MCEDVELVKGQNGPTIKLLSFNFKPFLLSWDFVEPRALGFCKVSILPAAARWALPVGGAKANGKRKGDRFASL